MLGGLGLTKTQHMFGDEQNSVLADQLQAAVMLRYNKRHVG